jgi:hypothetical protein
MSRVIEVEFGDGQTRRVTIEPTSRAGEITVALDVSGFLLVTSDGHKVHPAEHVYDLVERGGTLTLSRSLTGGKGAAEMPFDLQASAVFDVVSS